MEGGTLSHARTLDAAAGASARAVPWLAALIRTLEV